MINYAFRLFTIDSISALLAVDGRFVGSVDISLNMVAVLSLFKKIQVNIVLLDPFNFCGS